MATSIPPHNLGEVCDAAVALIDDPEIDLEGLMEHIHGPDFPTGGTICGRWGIREAYRTGRGKVIIRAKHEIEEMRDGRSQIIFTEIPYQLTKAPLLIKLAELVTGDRVTGVTDIVDESDRKQPVRIVVKVKRGEDPNVILNQLYQYSPLQDSFSVIMLALVDGRPRGAAAQADAPAVHRPPGQRDPPPDPVPAPPGQAAGAHRRGPADRPGVHRRDHPGDPVVRQPGRGPGPPDGDGGGRRDLAAGTQQPRRPRRPPG